MDDGLPKAALGAGDMFAVYSDSDAVKEVVNYMLSPTFFEAAAQRPDNLSLIHI